MRLLHLPLFLIAAAPLIAQSSPLLEALNSLEAGNYAQAAQILDRANVRATADARSLLTLGVSLVLAERYEDSIEPLERAIMLKRLDEADLWLYASERISGIVTERHAYSIRPRGQPLQLSGTPRFQSPEYPSDYATFVYYEMPREPITARLDPSSANTALIQSTRREAARRFVALRFKDPDLARLARQSSTPLAQETNYPQRMTRLLQTMDLTDPTWLNEFGVLNLNLGRYVSARRASTLLLNDQPTNASALLRRAWSAARMGDSTRTRADLESAARIDPASTAKLRPKIEADLAAIRPSGSVSSLLAALNEAARQGLPLKDLIARARNLHLAWASQRIIYEERYSSDRASFESSLRSQPSSADVRANYARYLINEADINRRGYSLEPRPVIEALRIGFNAPRELARAQTLIDQALTLNANHVRSLLLKAIILDRLGRFAEGKPFVDRAMRLAPNDPEALRLRSEYLWSANNDALNAASNLRTPTIEGVRTYDQGNYRVTETTYRDPSNYDRSRADSLDQSATELRAGARAAQEAAIRASAGTPEGFILLAEQQSVNKRFAEARSTLTQGLAKFPRSLLIHEAFVRFAKRTRDLDLEDDEQSAALNLLESTAAPKLRKAWRAILRTDWPTANAALDEATLLYPTDARTFAYCAILLEQLNQRPQAARYWLTALAVEEALLSFDDSPSSSGVSRSPSSLGLVLALRLRIIGNAKDSPLAEEIARDATAHASRIQPGDRSMLLWRALFPDPTIEESPGRDKQGRFRWAPNAATMAAAAQVAYGRALSAAGNPASARTQFEAALVWGQSQGNFVASSAAAPPERDFNNGVAIGPISEAYLEMAKIAIAQKDINTALNFINKASGSKPNEEVRQEIDKLVTQVQRLSQGEAPSQNRPRNPFSRKKTPQ
jgi:Flp pilus assembly protein TadD